MDNWTPRPDVQMQATCDLGFSLFTGLLASTLRSSDHDAVGKLIVGMFASHHDNYFLEGLRKLGLDSEESDAIKSAKYHYFSNVLGGIDMGYAEESRSKAWVFYNTPFCYFDSPFWPSATAAFMRWEGYAEVFRAWHGNNGRSLGNRRVGFVFTHMLFRGDPYDAGYFIEADEDLPPGESYRTNWGEEPPPMTRIELDPAAWTTDRRLKAACNYHVGYVSDTIGHLVRLFGLGEAAAIYEHAYKVFLLQARERIAGYLDVDLAAPGATALLLKRYQQLFRETTAIDSRPGATVVRQDGSYAERYMPDGVPAEIDGAIASAWGTLASYLEPGTSVALSRTPTGREWRFTPG